MTTEKQKLKLDQIRIDGGTQSRVSIDEHVVAEYAELYSNGFELPPIVVFFDGATYWLADGFHRYFASKRINRTAVSACVHEGTRRDAILHAVAANTTHGLRRSNQDKQKAVEMLLHDEQWSQWSDRQIARQCGVSDRMVNKYRQALTAKVSQSNLRRTANGRSMDTTNIGSASPSKTRRPKGRRTTPATIEL